MLTDGKLLVGGDLLSGEKLLADGEILTGRGKLTLGEILTGRGTLTGGKTLTGFSALNSVTSSSLRSFVNSSVLTYSSHSAMRVLIVKSFLLCRGEAIGFTLGRR